MVSENAVIGGFAAAAKRTRRAKALNITFWVLQILAALMFLMSGGMKLAGVPMQVEMFGKIGIGQWFRYVTGTIEIVSAILLFMPRTAAVGASLLVVTMLGAIATHLLVLGGSPLPAIVLLVVTASIAWYRGWSR